MMRITNTVPMMTTLAMALSTSVAIAQNQQQDDPWSDRPADERERQYDQPQQGQQDRVLMMHHADAEIIDASISNMQQENLGNIAALVIDMQSEQVTYAIVSFGGVLGIGDELHAVPWSAFEFRPMHDGLILDVSQTQLERQEGFTREQLPDFTDRQWGQRIHEQFNTQPSWSREDQQRDDQQPMTDPETDEPTYPGMQGPRFVTTYDLIGVEVENVQGESIGNIRDFAMNLHDGKVQYLVMGYGGWLGIGETHTAMPLNAFEPRNFATENPVLLLDITQDQLRGAEEYDPNRWPHRGATNWTREMNSNSPRSTPVR